MGFTTTAGQQVTATLLNQIAALSVAKPTDESVTLSATLQNDNDLVLPVAASSRYRFTCYLNYEGGTGGSSDIKWTWTVPSGASMRYIAVYENLTPVLAGAATNKDSDTVQAQSNGAGSLRSILMTGELTVSTTAGNIQLQWAQNTSNGTATIVHTGSLLELQRIS